MWSNVISIDKGFGREIEFILAKLQKIRHLSFAVEESRDRVFFYIASVCEMQEEVEGQVRELLQTVFLVFMKLRFFLGALHNMDLNHANCALICSLVHFDSEYEKGIVSRVLSETCDYAVDGLMHFRLRPLSENWEELAALATRLIASGGGGDIYDIASFITGTDGAKKPHRSHRRFPFQSHRPSSRRGHRPFRSARVQSHLRHHPRAPLRDTSERCAFVGTDG